MLHRNIKITFRPNIEEHQSLANQIKKTGLSQEAFIRALIRGYEPRELPPIDYHAMIRELQAIGSNFNQIAARANATGHIDSATFSVRGYLAQTDGTGHTGSGYCAEKKNGGGEVISG